jgi:hypothetical protein
MGKTEKFSVLGHCYPLPIHTGGGAAPMLHPRRTSLDFSPLYIAYPGLSSGYSIRVTRLG